MIVALESTPDETENAILDGILYDQTCDDIHRRPLCCNDQMQSAALASCARRQITRLLPPAPPSSDPASSSTMITIFGNFSGSFFCHLRDLFIVSFQIPDILLGKRLIPLIISATAQFRRLLLFGSVTTGIGDAEFHCRRLVHYFGIHHDQFYFFRICMV